MWHAAGHAPSSQSPYVDAEVTSWKAAGFEYHLTWKYPATGLILVVYCLSWLPNIGGAAASRGFIRPTAYTTQRHNHGLCDRKLRLLLIPGTPFGNEQDPTYDMRCDTNPTLRHPTGPPAHPSPELNFSPVPCLWPCCLRIHLLGYLHLDGRATPASQSKVLARQPWRWEERLREIPLMEFESWMRGTFRGGRRSTIRQGCSGQSAVEKRSLVDIQNSPHPTCIMMLRSILSTQHRLT
ncbi:hypothetical protein LZ30DRAFT_163508 [Colletotrichum cereale]|nr:hypothetical protein LZ30DRAFT_163508 [Colletotrichum cereale]